MIIQQITLNQFIDGFKSMDRDYFSYEGYETLYDYLEDFEGLADANYYELDVIALCCEFTEYTEDEIINDYSYLVDFQEYDEDEHDELVEAIVAELHSRTMVMELNKGSYIIREF